MMDLLLMMGMGIDMLLIRAWVLMLPCFFWKRWKAGCAGRSDSHAWLLSGIGMSNKVAISIASLVIQIDAADEVVVRDSLQWTCEFFP